MICRVFHVNEAMSPQTGSDVEETLYRNTGGCGQGKVLWESLNFNNSEPNEMRIECNILFELDNHNSFFSIWTGVGLNLDGFLVYWSVLSEKKIRWIVHTTTLALLLGPWNMLNTNCYR